MVANYNVSWNTSNAQSNVGKSEISKDCGKLGWVLLLETDGNRNTLDWLSRTRLSYLTGPHSLTTQMQPVHICFLSNWQSEHAHANATHIENISVKSSINAVGGPPSLAETLFLRFETHSHCSCWISNPTMVLFTLRRQVELWILMPPILVCLTHSYTALQVFSNQFLTVVI